MSMSGTTPIGPRSVVLRRADVAATGPITGACLTGSSGFYRYFFGGFSAGGMAPDST
jgi:hypothetical protein